jgi:hypothetical protein
MAPLPNKLGVSRISFGAAVVLRAAASFAVSSGTVGGTEVADAGESFEVFVNTKARHVAAIGIISKPETTQMGE